MFLLKLLLALQFLTRIPITVRGSFRDGNMAGSMTYFPLVGLLLGASAAGVNILLSTVFSPSVCEALESGVQLTGPEIDVFVRKARAEINDVLDGVPDNNSEFRIPKNLKT
jgi:hypothetical protein